MIKSHLYLIQQKGRQNGSISGNRDIKYVQPIKTSNLKIPNVIGSFLVLNLRKGFTKIPSIPFLF